jgi:hypothetical protein
MADTELIRGVIFDLDHEVNTLAMKLRIARLAACGMQHDPHGASEDDLNDAVFNQIIYCEATLRVIEDLKDKAFRAVVKGAPKAGAGDYPSTSRDDPTIKRD